MTEADYRRVGVSGTLKGYGDSTDAIKNSYYKIALAKMEDQEGDVIETKGELSAVFEGIYHSRTELKLGKSKRFYENTFNPCGNYFDVTQVEFQASFRATDSVLLNVTVTTGDQIDYANA